MSRVTSKDGTSIAYASLPHAERLVMPRQSHVADPNAVGPVLERFLGG